MDLSQLQQMAARLPCTLAEQLLVITMHSDTMINYFGEAGAAAANSMRREELLLHAGANPRPEGGSC